MTKEINTRQESVNYLVGVLLVYTTHHDSASSVSSSVSSRTFDLSLVALEGLGVTTEELDAAAIYASQKIVGTLDLDDLEAKAIKAAIAALASNA